MAKKINIFLRLRFLNLLFLLFFLISCKNSENKLFEFLSYNETNIKFSNRLIESDSINIIDYEYFYNGAGVALADLNKDGLLDIFFATFISFILPPKFLSVKIDMQQHFDL